MNDRYLYKAKRIDTGEWVEGFLGMHTFIPAEESGKETYIGTVIKKVPERIYDCESYEVDPSTICACTGLKDENGQKIWENDIVTGWFDDERITGYIMYGSNAHFFIERKGLYCIQFDNSQDWLEVTGNIFDNPELLEQ